MVYFLKKETLLGPITLASDGVSLTGLWFDGQKYFGSTIGGELTDLSVAAPDLPIFAETVRWLDLYFSGRDPGFTPALSFGDNATPFRVLVWQELLKIPYGQTVTYGELARRIGALPAYAEGSRTGQESSRQNAGQACPCRVSARAVGGAVGRNPISLIVPCHRVIGADGRLTGYAGGVERKRKLLEMERAL